MHDYQNSLVNVLVTVEQHLGLHNGHQAGVLGNGGVAGQAVGAVAQGDLAGACRGKGRGCRVSKWFGTVGCGALYTAVAAGCLAANCNLCSV